MKKFSFFSVKKKKLFERSEFFFFRKRAEILASEREPANFLCFVSFLRGKEMKSLTQYSHFPSHHTACSFGRGGASLGITTPQYER